MTVEQTDVVDFVGVNRADGRVVLTVSDHLPWDDDDHVLTLQDKLNAYIRFVESGQLLKEHPAVAERAVQIHIVCKYPPSEVGVQFLEMARRKLEAVGIDLTHEVFADE